MFRFYIYARIYDEKGVGMAEKAVNNGQNNEVPCGIRQRLDYNADFRLDWHDPDEATDGYQLKWIGKDYARLQSGTAPETVIIPDKKHNAELENKDSQNIFITGDNLQALKHLQNAYYGSVDMIYIDPPYNTGSDGFVYNDKFEFNDEQLQDNLGLTEEQIKRLKVINGRSSHSAWLTFMYPRLRIARTLLKDTGVIFISIDDNEQANLKLLCDEIFGERNFVGQITVASNPRGRDYGGIARMHDYLLVYKKSADAEVNNIRDEDKKFPFEDSISGFEIRELRNRNIAFTSENRPNLYYPFYINANNIIDNEFYEISLEKKENWTELYPKESQGYKTVWRWGKEKSKKNLNINILAKKMKDGGYQIIEKYREKSYMARSIWNTKEVNTEKGTLELKKLMRAKVFSFPKPVDMICDIIEMGANQDSIILDFFAGSATTAHAVMQLNKEDGGNRRYIMVQLDELTWELDKNGNKTAKEGSKEAFKAGYTSIDQIARERIKRAAKQTGGSTGFKHFYVRSPDTAALSKITEFNPDNPNADKLFTEDIVQELGGTDVILQTWMAADGYMLTDIPQEIDIAGYKAYYCGNSVLYLIENGWQQANTKALLNLIGGNKINVNTIICCAYSFSFESMSELETNIRQSLSEISVEKRY